MRKLRSWSWSDVVVGAVVVAAFFLDVTGALTTSLAVSLSVAAIAVSAVYRSRVAQAKDKLAAAASQRAFTHLFGASPVPQSISRLTDGVVLAVNPAYQSHFGVREAEIIGHRPSDVGIVVPEREKFLEILRSGQPIRGSDIWCCSPAGDLEVIVSSCVGTFEGAQVAMSTFVDVTERNRARRGAREIEGRMREVVENLEEVTWLTDRENSVMLYISPAYEKVFGRQCAALYADSRDWLLAVHPDDRERMTAWTTPETGAGHGHYRIVRPDGTVRSIEFRMFPVTDHSGVVVRFAGVANDVTERLVLEEQLRQTQKLESIGLLAGGVAHDFNNVLAVISGNLGLLAESVPTTGMEHELVEEIDAAVTRAAGLTRQLLAFSRKQPVEPIAVNLNDAVKDTRKMLRRMVGEDIVITTSLDPETAAITIDPGYLVQVLMNLAVNARDAMPRGGTFALSTRNVPGASEVMLEVSDTGTGMTPEVRARVFEPFFTTKELGRGTGLGLSVVHGIVEQAGGHIELDSVPGSGTTFRFYLPATDQPIAAKPNVTRQAPSGNEKILVVDDDAFVRNAAARALRARGYTVVEARDAFDAMARLCEHPGITLLVTDVIMPGLDGGELARLAKAECPDLKVLFTSGYTDDALFDHGIRTMDGAFLEKPYGTHVLAGKVRQILDASSPA